MAPLSLNGFLRRLRGGGGGGGQNVSRRRSGRTGSIQRGGEPRRKWTLFDLVSNYSSSGESAAGCFRKSASMSNCMDGDALTHSSSSSSTAGYHCTSGGGGVAAAIRLPEKLLHLCLDAIDDPFELCKLRTVSCEFANYVNKRLERVVEMDVHKVRFDTLSRLPNDACTTPNSLKTNGDQSNTMVLENGQWYAHPAGHKLLMRFVELSSLRNDATESGNGGDTRLEILTDESWTSKDVARLHALLKTFRGNLRKISLDAPIIELVIASLSMLDLDRWYAFQCFMKAVNDHQMHLALTHIPPKQGTADSTLDFFWPNVESLVIRTTDRWSSHLARILDYGVRSQLVMDRRKLETLKVLLTDVDKMNRDLIRNLYHFRCWAGSAGFDDRFSQQTLKVR